MVSHGTIFQFQDLILSQRSFVKCGWLMNLNSIFIEGESNILKRKLLTAPWVRALHSLVCKKTMTVTKNQKFKSDTRAEKLAVDKFLNHYYMLWSLIGLITQQTDTLRIRSKITKSAKCVNVHYRDVMADVSEGRVICERGRRFAKFTSRTGRNGWRTDGEGRDWRLDTHYFAKIKARCGSPFSIANRETGTANE